MGELSKRPGMYMYHDNVNISKTICFGLKGNIMNGGNSMSWKLYHDTYFEGYICLEAIICVHDEITDSVQYTNTNMFLSYDEKSTKVTLLPKFNSDSVNENTNNYSSSNNKTYSIDNKMTLTKWKNLVSW